MRHRLVGRVALRLCLPASAGTWRLAKPGVTNDSAAPALRWAAEWSQRDHYHQGSCPDAPPKNSMRTVRNQLRTFAGITLPFAIGDVELTHFLTAGRFGRVHA